MLPKNRTPAHPGEILQRIYLDDLGINQTKFANHLGWKPGKINEIVRKKRGITPETALAFADALNTDPQMWLNLQTNYDLYNVAKTYKKIKPIKFKTGA